MDTRSPNQWKWQQWPEFCGTPEGYKGKYMMSAAACDSTTTNVASLLHPLTVVSLKPSETQKYKTSLYSSASIGTEKVQRDNFPKSWHRRKTKEVVSKMPKISQTYKKYKNIGTITNTLQHLRPIPFARVVQSCFKLTFPHKNTKTKQPQSLWHLLTGLHPNQTMLEKIVVRLFEFLFFSRAPVVEAHQRTRRVLEINPHCEGESCVFSACANSDTGTCRQLKFNAVRTNPTQELLLTQSPCHAQVPKSPAPLSANGLWHQLLSSCQRCFTGVCLKNAASTDFFSVAKRRFVKARVLIFAIAHFVWSFWDVKMFLGGEIRFGVKVSDFLDVHSRCTSCFEGHFFFRGTPFVEVHCLVEVPRYTICLSRYTTCSSRFIFSRYTFCSSFFFRGTLFSFGSTLFFFGVQVFVGNFFFFVLNPSPPSSSLPPLLLLHFSPSLLSFQNLSPRSHKLGFDMREGRRRHPNPSKKCHI